MNKILSQKIIALERELHQQHTRESVRRVNELLSIDFVEFGRSGKRYTKSMVLRHLSTESRRRISAKGFKLRVISSSAVLLMYAVKDESMGKTVLSWRSSLWVKQGKAWRMAFHQATPIQSK